MIESPRPRFSRTIAAGLLLILAVWSLACAAAGPGRAAVASAHPAATAAGLEILEQGGNAFDAAVAISAALAVVEPAGSGLGGGGFWLLHRARDNHTIMVDGRERAPLAASADMYLDPDGAFQPKWSQNGPLAAAIPGEPAALVHLAKHYGRLPLATSLDPAIRLARDGFPVGRDYALLAGYRLPALLASPAARRTFLAAGIAPVPGWTLRQPDLADTLRALARNGHDGFYRGAVAERLVKGVRAAGGLWTLDDLANYQVTERAAIIFTYRDMRVVSAAPPSSGGVVLAEAMSILDGVSLPSAPAVDRIHWITEAMRRAYRDRAQYLGDPDFVVMPLDRLLSPAYAVTQRQSIDPHRATPSVPLESGSAAGPDRHTTHFCVIDADGNRVAATLSINTPFGSAFMPPGTGVVLNNEMDDFAAAPGEPNAYGLVGSKANAIAPGKRPLSSMSPTFLEQGDRLGIVGTPGGSRIISMVLLASLAFAEGADAAAMVALPRYHHQYLPDRLFFEPEAFDEATIQRLEDMGHRLETVSRRYGDMQAITWDRRSGALIAASDPRGEGEATVQAAGEAIAVP
ncbi:MAG: gamma-glutamyltransferase [Pseudomonadota bacterium]|nr:gamma-glutamyltransferase [Pseudomonadota bacterium]